MSITMYADMKRRERENVKKRGRKRRGEMREREFGTFTLLFLNVNIHFRAL